MRIAFKDVAKKPWVLGAIGLVVVAALIFYGQRPTRVAEGAVDRLAKLSTAKFGAVLQLQNAQATQQILGEQGTVELALDGVFARRENARDSLQSDVILTTKTESVSVAVEGDVRFIDDKAFLFIGKAPAIFGLLYQLKGQWLELPRGEDPATGGGVAANEVADSGTIFTNVKRVGTEEINGRQTVKYQAVATEQAVIGMMDSIAELLGTRLSSEQIASIRQSVQQVGTVPVELWIRRWSLEVEKLSATLTVPGANTVRFTLTIHERNPRVEIVPPEGAVTFEQAARAAATTPLPAPR